MASGSTRRRGAPLPPFQPAPKHKQDDLRRDHVVWEWVERGQEWGKEGGGNFLIRCRLCQAVFTGSRSRGVEHFTKQKAYCPWRSAEILYKLQTVGAVLKDAISQRLASEYAQRVDGDMAADDLRQYMEAERGGEVEQSQPGAPLRGKGADGGDAGGGTIRLANNLDPERRRGGTTRGGTQRTGFEDALPHGEGGVGGLSDTYQTGGCSVSRVPASTSIVPRRHTLPEFAAEGHCPTAFCTTNDERRAQDCEVHVQQTKSVCTSQGHEEGVGAQATAEMRFDTTYMMLERLYDQREVFDTLVSSERWARVQWAGDARERMPYARRLCRDDGSWRDVKRVLDVMGPVYEFLRDLDRDGSSPTGLWDLEAILWQRLHSLDLLDVDRDAVMDIVRDRYAMMRQPTHAAAYLLDPRRRGISLLEERNRPIVQSVLEHFALVVGGWDTEAMQGLWEVLWTFHNDNLRYLGIARKVMGMWSTTSPCERNWQLIALRNRLSAHSVEKLVFMHWNLHLLSASKRTKSRYMDIWANQVEEEEVVVDVDDTIPADVPDKEAEAIERSNRRKERRNRAGKGKAPVVESEDEEEGIFDDLVWMHQGIRKEAQAQRAVGTTLPEDQHDLLDEWGGTRWVGSARRLGRIRWWHHAYYGVHEREVWRHASSAWRRGWTPQEHLSIQHESLEQQHRPRVEQRVEQTAERTVYSRVDDMLECRVELRVEQRVGQRVDERVEQRVDQRMRDVVEVIVDVTLDQRRDRGTEESARGVPSDRHSGKSVIRDVVICGSTEQRLDTDSAAGDRPGLDGIGRDRGDMACIRDTGIPPLPPQDTSPSSYDVLTRRTFYGIPPLPLRMTSPALTAMRLEIHLGRSTTPGVGGGHPATHGRAPSSTHTTPSGPFVII
ncbi:hypothetical protein CBR_g46702 [Chara braunii]|uniref:HAT C-terminal dimerisation domain-containing protein n=1 Tax=Chara braunii TaxID=69332 RepID=A0A388K3X7_CHABU|nr:hypothetical protein CBR_g46702 [Chara braunii]|eukprot:GBG64745.1 hypothetical protein CBR_g46702 [Chara braunii]